MKSQTARALSTALITSLIFVGCGKKKELNTGGEAVPTPTAPAPANPAQPAGPRQDFPLGGNPQQDSRDQHPRGGGEQKPPQIPDLRPLPEDGNQRPLPPRGDQDPEAQVPAQPGPKPGDNPAAVVNFDAFEGRHLTGFKTEKDGMFYSGAGSDSVLEHFKKVDSTLPDLQKKKNLRRASEIESVRIEIDPEGGDALLTLTLTTGSKYTLAGSPDGEQYSKLRQVRSLTTGRLLVKGYHKCLDIDGRCQTSYSRVQFSDGAEVRVVHRNSIADYHVVLPKTDSGTQDYVLWEAFLINGALKNSTPKRLGNVEVSSWEVVNGRSAVQGRLLGVDGNLVAFSGPLLMPEAGTRVSLAMSRLTEEKPSDDLMTLRGNHQFEYANMLSEIRMINNNGRGQMRFQLKIRKRSIYPQDIITMTIARVEYPVMDAREIAEFEKRK